MMNWTFLVESYLAQKRRLGYSLVSEGRYLQGFADFAGEQGDGITLSVSLALRWANLAPSGSDISIARRFCLLRPFSRYLNSLGYDSIILPAHFIGPTHRRLPPYIFSDAEITELMEAANQLFPTNGLRPATMKAFVGLLASTGLRPGEAVRLRCEDLTLEFGEITIRNSKGWKERQIFLSPSSIEALKLYVNFRDRFNASGQVEAFFQLERGRALDIRAADYAFGLLRDAIGLSTKLNDRRPRLYDLRHTFVCRRVIAWYQSDEDIDCRVAQLSRHLGHKKVSNTYWYLTAIPELMACATKRFAGTLSLRGSNEHAIPNN